MSHELVGNGVLQQCFGLERFLKKIRREQHSCLGEVFFLWDTDAARHAAYLNPIENLEWFSSQFALHLSQNHPEVAPRKSAFLGAKMQRQD